MTSLTCPRFVMPSASLHRPRWLDRLARWMGANGEAEIGCSGAADGKFLIDDNGNLKICGNFCNDPVYVIYTEGVASTLKLRKIVQGASAWVISFSPSFTAGKFSSKTAAMRVDSTGIYVVYSRNSGGELGYIHKVSHDGSILASAASLHEDSSAAHPMGVATIPAEGRLFVSTLGSGPASASSVLLEYDPDTLAVYDRIVAFDGGLSVTRYPGRKLITNDAGRLVYVTWTGKLSRGFTVLTLSPLSFSQHWINNTCMSGSPPEAIREFVHTVASAGGGVYYSRHGFFDSQTPTRHGLHLGPGNASASAAPSSAGGTEGYCSVAIQGSSTWGFVSGGSGPSLVEYVTGAYVGSSGCPGNDGFDVANTHAKSVWAPNMATTSGAQQLLVGFGGLYNVGWVATSTIAPSKIEKRDFSFNLLWDYAFPESTAIRVYGAQLALPGNGIDDMQNHLDVY